MPQSFVTKVCKVLIGFVYKEGVATSEEDGDLVVEVDVPEERSSRVIGILTIICDGLSASRLHELGEYDWRNPWVTDDRFPIQPHDPVTRTIVLVQCSYYPTSEDVLNELRSHDLERPTHENALQFGRQHPLEQTKTKHVIVFLHELVLDQNGNPCFITLRGDVDHRSIYLIEGAYGWDRGDVFAGVRKT